MSANLDAIKNESVIALMRQIQRGDLDPAATERCGVFERCDPARSLDRDGRDPAIPQSDLRNRGHV